MSETNAAKQYWLIEGRQVPFLAALCLKFERWQGKDLFIHNINSHERRISSSVAVLIATTEGTARNGC